MVKTLLANAVHMGSIPGSRISHGEGNGNPLQYFCLEKSHGQSSLSGYSPWGLKELDMIEHEYMPSALPVLAHSVFIVIL